MAHNERKTNIFPDYHSAIDNSTIQDGHQEKTGMYVVGMAVGRSNDKKP